MLTPLALALALFAGPPKDLAFNTPPVFTEETRTLAAPNRILVKFRHSEDRLAALAMGYKVLREIPKIGYTVLLVPYGKVDASLRAITATGLVDEAQADHVYMPAYTPNDPLFPGQWNLFDQRIPQAWDITRGNKGIVIAVLDTGVDYNHRELASNMWTNKGEIPGDGIDNDGNGCVDDVRGWDFGYNDNDPMDDYGHGTSCAGINAAVQDNGFELTGIAPKCHIMPVKIAQSDGYSYDFMFAPAVIYAADNGARVMSISFFGDGITPALRAASDYAYDSGVLMCAAAGNFNSIIPLYPAAYDHCLAVAAHIPGDTKASFSNFGTWVDISAPGTGITATTWGGGYTTSFAGTSAATPNAAGVVALIRSAHIFEGPDMIRHRLEYSALPMQPVADGEVSNYGRIDAFAAVRNDGPKRLRVKPEVRYFSPMALPAEGGHLILRGRVFEPSFRTPNVTLNGQALQVVADTDKRLEVIVPPGSASGSLVVGTPVESNPVMLSIKGSGTTMETGPSDVQFVNGVRAYGTARDLWYEDGKALRGLGRDFTMDAVFRGIDKNTVSQLRLRLEETSSALPAGAICTVTMYDFSTGSYPYGSYATVASFHPNAIPESLAFDINGDVSRFVSYEGDLYVRFTTGLNDSQGYIDIDRFWFEYK